MYRPPKDQNFFNTLSDEIEKLWAQKKNILIMGDLNADILLRYSENEDDEKAAGKKIFYTLLIDLVLKMWLSIRPKWQLPQKHYLMSLLSVTQAS